jgi:glycosyltransferase involved in cell wall biosynthesis
LIDVLIQTFNEELNLAHTLESVKGWANRIFVVDSGSTDRTVKIAEQYGASVVSHAWEGYAQQKNWALSNLPFESPWILILDADESVSPELRDEMLAIAARKPEDVPEAGYYLNRVFVFLGKKIFHCGYFPSWNLRFFKTGCARYEERLVHEHMIVDGPTGYLTKLLVHEDRRGLEHFFAKHNRYSTLEAREIFEHPQEWPGVGGFIKDRIARRRFLKSRVVPKVPVSWVMRFLYMYVFRAGFMDGWAGWKLCNFISTYEFLIQTKYQELKRLRNLGLFEPPVKVALSEPEGQITREQETGLQLKGAPRQIEAKAGTGTPKPTTPANTGLGQSLVQPVPSDIEVRSPKVPSVVNEPPIALNSDPLAVQPSRGVELMPAGGADLPARTGKVKVSIMIPTLNEEANMPRCLDHLAWADEVVVVDSGSTDRTVEIAHAYGARVVNFEWNGQWPKKKNWALRHVDFRNDWVLIVDADEWIVPDLASEIAQAIEEPGHAGFYVNRRFIFMGRWIKHCGYYPSWNLRLIKRGQGEYEQLTGVGNTGSGDNEVHEHVVPRGKVGYLDNDMLHFAFPTIHTFMEKHNRYSNWEAAVQFRRADADNAAIGTELSKRRRLKNLSRKLPFRSTLRFLYSYVWKGGFLDGQPGYVFCRLLAIYEYLSVAKYVELKRAEEDRKMARSLSAVPETDWRLQNATALAAVVDSRADSDAAMQLQEQQQR